jgi:lipopolysaccharide biosynthesis protein
MLPIAQVRRELGSVHRLAILAHVYHFELWPELVRHLGAIPRGFAVDCFVSVVDAVATPANLAAIRALRPDAQVVICQNRGADVGGLFAVLRDPRCAGRYDAWCKVHTKRSANCPDPAAGAWRRCLQGDILGSESVALSCLYAIANLGAQVVGSRWCLLDAAVDDATRQLLGLPPLAVASFVAGTMFWASGGVLDVLRDSPLRPESFAPGFAHDGRIEHALERGFGGFGTWGSSRDLQPSPSADAYTADVRALPFLPPVRVPRSVVTVDDAGLRVVSS